MALKLALLSFEFNAFKGLEYESRYDHDFAQGDPVPGQSIQPVIDKAFKKIKQCIKVISSSFHYGQTSIQNINNFLHLGTSVYNSDILLNDGTQGQYCIVFTGKFYRLDDAPLYTYKVTVEIEEMPNSSMNSEHPSAFKPGMCTKQVEKLVELLDRKFNLNGRIEYTPVIKWGRLDTQRWLVSSDERTMEYDFDKVLFHKRSEFQDVKIVSSPSLGNTLLLDNMQNLSEVDLEYTYTLMDRGKVSYKDKDILILGGGDGGLLWELLKEEPKFVTMAEIDPVVIEACRDHLKPCGKALESLTGSNYEIVIDDCMKVLRNSMANGKKYDVIFNDLTDIPVCKREESLTAFEPSAVQKDNPWHFIEAIFNLSLDCLADDGLYMNHATGKGSIESIKAYENFLNNSRKKVVYESRSSYVPSFMEIWLFYTIKKKKSVLENSVSTNTTTTKYNNNFVAATQ